MSTRVSSNYPAADLEKAKGNDWKLTLPTGKPGEMEGATGKRN
jgi:hypothetical protein